jgi:cytochrome c-type biogenesis protein CcmH/NrfG
MVQWEGKGDAKAAVASWEKLLQVDPNYPERSRVEELISRAKQHTTIKPGTTTEKPVTM